VSTSQRKYLSGPYPGKLAVDSGNLRARGPVFVAGRSAIPGEFGRIQLGIGVKYGWTHEQKGIEGDTKVIWAKSPKGMTFFWMRRSIWVHGAMRVVIPSRPWLYPAIIDCLKEIRLILQRKVIQAKNQASGTP